MLPSGLLSILFITFENCMEILDVILFFILSYWMFTLIPSTHATTPPVPRCGIDCRQLIEPPIVGV